MIRVNLTGGERKKVAKAGAKAGGAPNLMSVVLVLIFVGNAVAGYLWYTGLTRQIEDLTGRIAAAEAEKAKLEAVIKANQVYEGRKKALENRIKVIEDLKNSQVSPVVSLDILGDAIEQTRYVWLSQLEQNNTTFNMVGIGTSVDSIADFVTNLERTGYFRNINLVNAQDSAGNFSFSMSCEFVLPSAVQRAPGAAGN